MSELETADEELAAGIRCKVCGGEANVHLTTVQILPDGTKRSESEHLCYTHAGFDEEVERQREKSMHALLNYLVEHRKSPTPEEAQAMGVLKNPPGSEGFEQEWADLQASIAMSLR
jgi:hypothetical protein